MERDLRTNFFGSEFPWYERTTATGAGASGIYFCVKLLKQCAHNKDLNELKLGVVRPSKHP